MSRAWDLYAAAFRDGLRGRGLREDGDHELAKLAELRRVLAAALANVEGTYRARAGRGKTSLTALGSGMV